MWFLLPNIDLRCFVVRQFLSRIYALLSVKFSGLKLCEYKKMTNIRYASQLITKPFRCFIHFRWSCFVWTVFGSFIIFRPATADYLQETSSLPSTGTGIEHLFTTRQFPSLNSKENLETLGIEFLRKVIIFKGLCERCQIKLQGIMFLLESIVRLVISYLTFEL